jgi:biopolymer transport protein ExbD
MSPAKRNRQLRAQTRLVPEEDPEFQIAPMIDILLVLLIFFMSISSSEVLQVNQEVQLPVAKDAKPPDTSTQGQTIINVTWNPINQLGGIDVDEKKYGDPFQITGALEPKVRANPKMRVLLRADKGVRYEYLRAVMVAAANAGVGNVTFSVVDKEAPKAPGAQ